MQVIPEGAGPVKPFCLLDCVVCSLSARCWARQVEAAEAWAPVPPGADWSMPRTMLVELLGLSLRLLVVSVSRAGVPAGAGPPGAASHPFAWQGMERLDTDG